MIADAPQIWHLSPTKLGGRPLKVPCAEISARDRCTAPPESAKPSRVGSGAPRFSSACSNFVSSSHSFFILFLYLLRLPSALASLQTIQDPKLQHYLNLHDVAGSFNINILRSSPAFPIFSFVSGYNLLCGYM